jgi:branched-chain amino acid transport system ATP-binding protein
MSLLTVRDLQVRYGGILAVHDLNLEVAEKEFVCLIGANGAGKTSTLKALSGMLTGVSGKVTGSVRYDQREICGHASHLIARLGVALVPEGRGIFPQLSVDENLAMGAYTRRDTEVAQDTDYVFSLFPRLAERRTQTGGTLSGGEQQMLAIGRAIMSRPRLLLLDEPSMGLAPLMVQKVFEAIQAVSRHGVAILLVEQNANLALQVADRGYVLDGGTITLTGPAATLAHDPKVRAAYLGG